MKFIVFFFGCVRLPARNESDTIGVSSQCHVEFKVSHIHLTIFAYSFTEEATRLQAKI